MRKQKKKDIIRFLNELLVLLIVCYLIWNIGAFFRNEAVYQTRMEILNDNICAYENLPDYLTMLHSFWLSMDDFREMAYAGCDVSCANPHDCWVYIELEVMVE
jgi:hypothetical protein